MNHSIASRKLTMAMATVLGIAVTAVVPASHALAQSGRAVVNVPFDFQTGSDHLKAGRYIVSMDSPHTLMLRSGKDASMALSRTEYNTTRSATGKLVFHRYGNRIFLREVWPANTTQHQVLPRSKSEKNVLLGQNATEPNSIEVALLEPIK